MHRQYLHEDWTLRQQGPVEGVPAALRGKRVEARVPGCVHLDLLASGLIADPYLDRNEEQVQWIGRTDWEYACCFEVGEAVLAQERVELVCEGLDTIARIELNGEEVGRGENMHLLYCFEVKAWLRPGENELRVRFSSALHWAENRRDEMGDLPNAYPQPFNFIRKMACNFGWDWGPTLVTAGIWQPLYLLGWSGVRLEEVRPLVVEANEQRARVEVRARVRGQGEVHCRLQGPDGGLVEGGARGEGGEAVVVLDVEKPRLWWPAGYGEQPLYALRVQAGEDVWERRIGVRSVRLDTGADEIGSAFTLEVNGRPVFCRGANWIPDDCFPPRVDRSRYERRVRQALGAHMNMLRVWGGGIYEQEAFYEVCDELGVLVWQDFLFACAAYPEEEPFGRLVEAEARYQIGRLSCHPSLVLWNGNNENIWGYMDWGWQAKIGGRTWGLGLYLDLLPRLVAELDPTRPYWPGSPYSGNMQIHPLADEHGNKHVWDAWNQKDYAVYRAYEPRFVSEFGHQAPPTWALLARAIPADQLRPDSPSMLHHQKAAGGNDKLEKRLQEHFALPDSFDDWLYLTQLNQARAMRCGVEWYRSRQPVCMGTLYWQLNDCWPVTSWAAIDGDGRPKPLWYATRHFYADRLLTIQPEGRALVLYAVNDADEQWRGEIEVRRMDFRGGVGARGHVMLEIEPRSCQRLMELGGGLAQPERAAGECLVAEGAGARALWFFDIDRRLEYPQPAFTAELERGRKTWHLALRAQVLLRDVAVFADRLDPEAAIDEQLVTLLPGERFTFAIESAADLEKEALLQPPVFQCANRFGRNSAK